MVIKNNAVSTHSIDILLSCNHINIEAIEAAIFVPQIGEKRVCKICKEEVEIKRVGQPYWNDKSNDT